MTHDGYNSTPTTYNDRGGVTSAGSASNYVTYGAGNTPMYSRTDGTTTTNYTNSSELGLMGEDYGNQRIYDRTPDGAAVGSRLGAGSKYYFIQDAIGSVVGIFDKDGNYYGGYTYGPYGAARFTSSNAALSNNNLRYISGYWDASAGDYLFGARYYDPLIGRFTQVDPSQQEVNSYAYAQDNPLNMSDPSGLSAQARAFHSGVILSIEFSRRLTKTLSDFSLGWTVVVALCAQYLNVGSPACLALVTDYAVTIYLAAQAHACFTIGYIPFVFAPWGYYLKDSWCRKH